MSIDGGYCKLAGILSYSTSAQPLAGTSAEGKTVSQASRSNNEIGLTGRVEFV